MVQTPEQAKEGDLIVFETSDGEEQIAPVPEKMQALAYFAVLTTDSQNKRVKRTRAMLPGYVKFQVPADGKPGATIVVDGPHGKLSVRLRDDAKPGDEAAFWLGPSMAYKFIVPEDKAPGDSLEFDFNGNRIQVQVPSDKKPGEEFNFIPPVLMVHAPKGSKAGDVVIYTRPDGKEQTACIPEGIQTG